MVDAEWARARRNAEALLRLVMRARPEMGTSEAVEHLLNHEPSLRVEAEQMPKVRRFKTRKAGR